ncbi:MAG: hypothetical protein AAB316_12310 [Bacteroidota bacterium]
MMPQLHQKILLFGLAFLLVLATIFQANWFTSFPGGGWLYIATVSISLPLFAWILGSFFSKKCRWLALVALLFLEAGVAFSLHSVASGRQLPQSLTRLMKYVYGYHCRVNVAFQEGKGRYDERLFYTLKPGSFEYSNLEFSTQFQVNSAGFRDDEASLKAPEIVFLGDSYGMGWGVEQGESYAEIVGERLGLRSLNAGIASYGTAREWLALQSFPLDSCQVVVIQFCVNDEAENRAFAANGFQLKVSPPAVYEDGVRWNEVSGSYFPFKYCHAVFAWALRKMEKEIARRTIQPGGEIIPPGGASQQGVAEFFAILEKMRAQFKGEIIVFNLGETKTTHAVFEQFSAWLATHPMPGVHVFPTHEHVSTRSYFTLDDHLNSLGHKQLGEALAAFILKRKLLER